MGGIDLDKAAAPDQDLRDTCIKCGAMGEWCYDSDIETDEDGWNTHYFYYYCEECGKSWAEAL